LRPPGWQLSENLDNDGGGDVSGGCCRTCMIK
jgi:hypothetical protein